MTPEERKRLDAKFWISAEDIDKTDVMAAGVGSLRHLLSGLEICLVREELLLRERKAAKVLEDALHDYKVSDWDADPTLISPAEEALIRAKEIRGEK